MRTTTTPAKGTTTTRPRTGSTTTTGHRPRIKPHTFTGTALKCEATERRLQATAKAHDVPASILLGMLARFGLDALAAERIRITGPDADTDNQAGSCQPTTPATAAP